MTSESKGRAWYDKIYRKLETILVEVDNFASQGNDSVSDEPEKLAENHSSSTRDMNHRVDPQKCKSPSNIPSDHKFDTSRSVCLEEQMERDNLKDKLLDSTLIDDEKMLSNSSLIEEHGDYNQTVTTFLCREQPTSSQGSHQCSPESFLTAIACNDDAFVSPSGIFKGDSNLIPLATEIQAAHVHQDKVASNRAFTVNQDECFVENEDFDDSPFDTIDLYDMTFREDPSDFDDNLLYAARNRTKQLRSFKRKIMDTLTSKRRREKEYEQLAIWFGDANMGTDLINTKEHATISLDSKSSESNVPSASEDSEWELL